MLLAQSDIALIVAAVCGVLTVLINGAVAVAVAFINARQNRTSRAIGKVDNKLSAIGEKVELVHGLANSMKTELVAVTRSDALQKGAAEERAKNELKGGAG